MEQIWTRLKPSCYVLQISGSPGFRTRYLYIHVVLLYNFSKDFSSATCTEVLYAVTFTSVLMCFCTSPPVVRDLNVAGHLLGECRELLQTERESEAAAVGWKLLLKQQLLLSQRRVCAKNTHKSTFHTHADPRVCMEDVMWELLCVVLM